MTASAETRPLIMACDVAFLQSGASPCRPCRRSHSSALRRRTVPVLRMTLLTRLNLLSHHSCVFARGIRSEGSCLLSTEALTPEILRGGEIARKRFDPRSATPFVNKISVGTDALRPRAGELGT